MLLWTLAIECHAQFIQEDPARAFAKATAENKRVLLVFSGSAWCVPCIQFEKKVLGDSQFIRFAGERLVVLIADFPQKKKVDPALRLQYDSLAQDFDPAGNFPQIVLLEPDRKLVGTLYFVYQPASEFIGQCRRLLIQSSGG